MKGNFHVQFLGEGVAATSPPYPTPGWATTQVYPARITAGSLLPHVRPDDPPTEPVWSSEPRGPVASPWIHRAFIACPPGTSSVATRSVANTSGISPEAASRSTRAARPSPPAWGSENAPPDPMIAGKSLERMSVGSRPTTGSTLPTPRGVWHYWGRKSVRLYAPG